MIELRGLSYSYPDGTPALRGINMKIDKGERVAVIGPNGAGKSTLFLHLNGILRPTTGEVIIDGKKMEYSRDLIKIRQKVGIVFQNPDDQLFSPHSPGGCCLWAHGRGRGEGQGCTPEGGYNRL